MILKRHSKASEIEIFRDNNIFFLLIYRTSLYKLVNEQAWQLAVFWWAWDYLSRKVLPIQKFALPLLCKYEEF